MRLVRWPGADLRGLAAQAQEVRPYPRQGGQGGKGLLKERNNRVH